MNDKVNPDRSRTGKTWDNEENWWREHYADRPYVQSGLAFEHYRPAYRYGTEAANHHLGRSWDEAAPDLRAGWASYDYRAKGVARAAWEDVVDAVRDAWYRVRGEADAANAAAELHARVEREGGRP